MASKKSTDKPELRAPVLREAMIHRIERHIAANGRMTFKCVPSLADHFANKLDQIFKLHGRPYSKAEIENLRNILVKHMEEGYKASPYSRVLVEYSTDAPPKDGLSYVVRTLVFTLEEQYQDWVTSRQPPLFGKYPDAKVLAIASSLGDPATVPVIDIGAGTGRNTLPLARLGHPTTAVELTPALLDILKASIDEEKLQAKLIVGDILEDTVQLPAGQKLAILCEVVSHFRDPVNLRTLFRRMADVIDPGGVLLFNIFLANDAYTPDKLAREMAQVYWATAYTRRELTAACEGFPFEKLDDESVYDFEKEHLPADGWPPTGWFEGWTQGRDIFRLDPPARPPIEFRWVTFRRT